MNKPKIKFDIYKSHQTLLGKNVPLEKIGEYTLAHLDGMQEFLNGKELDFKEVTEEMKNHFNSSMGTDDLCGENMLHLFKKSDIFKKEGQGIYGN